MKNSMTTILMMAFSSVWCIADTIDFIETEKSVKIHINGKPFADYVFEDEHILRPYFAHIHAPNGVQVSRNHPPIKDKDPEDHAAMHPGLWMAFGDISGKDYWRNKAKTQHVTFTQKPKIANNTGSFSVLNAYLNEGHVVCNAENRFTIAPQEQGVLLVWDVEFYSDDAAFVFGDQEEMGLGIRVATPIMAKNGGMILNQEKQVNEKGVWGKPSNWCVYKGQTGDEEVGMMIMPSPKNFRPSWFHARDYGLLVANPFGRNAFTNQEKSAIEVKKDEHFHLQFGIYIFSHSTNEFNGDHIYKKYVDTYASN